jgi:hypothetical protein
MPATALAFPTVIVATVARREAPDPARSRRAYQKTGRRASTQALPRSLAATMLRAARRVLREAGDSPSDESAATENPGRRQLFEQFSRRHAQRPREPTDVPDAQVPLAALDLADHGPVKSSLMGKLLLRPLSELAEPLHVIAYDYLAVDGLT